MNAHTELTYSSPCDGAEMSVRAAVFADNALVRAEWCEDADMAGIPVLRFGSLAEHRLAAEDEVAPLGDVVLVDCPHDDAASLARLARLDQRAARAGAAMVVSTTRHALESVFFFVDQSRAELLVEPSRADRIVALGRVMAHKPRARLRELSDDDRLSLLRLTQQVADIASRLERLGMAGRASDGGAFRFESPRRDFRGDEAAERALLGRPKPPLPDALLVRRIIHQRQLRAKFFDAALFADPAWDMLLDLTAARVEGTRVSVSSLCIASGVPPTTALRWIGEMVEAGLLVRQQDDVDRRRAFIALSDTAAEAMARYFAELGKEAGSLV